MKKNLGVADRIIRTIVAVVIAVLFFTNIISGLVGIILLVAAVVFLLTSLISICPLYSIFGISSCSTKE